MKTAIETVTCHWCHNVIAHANGNNLVHLGGAGDVYACELYLQGGDCRKLIRRFAHKPLVCRGCGHTIHKETYIEVGNGIYGGKAYHIKCEIKGE